MRDDERRFELLPQTPNSTRRRARRPTFPAVLGLLVAVIVIVPLIERLADLRTGVTGDYRARARSYMIIGLGDRVRRRRDALARLDSLCGR